ncbi:hypothetical protein QT327_21240 [Olivibacter sp. 47]|uniref:hypothetical protein n=1 Tax=Olivibacter sp. 47 TaxID=3056486 RepID=UPI0025A3391B|nr:hypothetical protein [Olivibacter sp. 47]MDM8176841.1 hypothetical protein [Olivibacter sp. 47]
MLGAHIIDGKDLYGTYKTFVESGSTGFLEVNTKPRFTHDWGDENGIEIDLTTSPLLKEREVSLGCVMRANSEQEFWINWKALVRHLSQNGLRRLYIGEYNRSFFVFLNSVTNFKKATRLSGSNYIGCTFTINLVEPSPDFWIQYNVLTDKNGNPLLTTNREKIIIKDNG